MSAPISLGADVTVILLVGEVVLQARYPPVSTIMMNIMLIAIIADPDTVGQLGNDDDRTQAT